MCVCVCVCGGGGGSGGWLGFESGIGIFQATKDCFPSFLGGEACM